MKNTIQFRNGFINLELSKKKVDNEDLALTVAAELMQFGYILSEDGINHLAQATKENIVKFSNEIIGYLKEATGSTRTYKAFWKGFPEEVMAKSERTLWTYQILHYWSGGKFEPSEWTKVRPTAFEQPKYTLIALGDEAKFLNIFRDLVSVNQSLTPDDLAVVKYFVESDQKLIFPDRIPFKENLCTLAGMGLPVPVKTVTDVLRIAVSMSGGDISLPKVPYAKVKQSAWRSTTMIDNPKRETFKFKKFSRSERKYILGLLENTNCDVREFALKDNRWVRLGEVLHPGDYSKQFPKAFQMFDDIRNTKVMTWYGEVNKAFNESFEKGLEKLSERPGEFIRRLDWLLRSATDIKRNRILSTLADIAPGSSNKVLYETLNHFEDRVNPVKGRSIMVKGSRKKTDLPDLPAIKKESIDSLQKTIIATLYGKFSQMESIGKVWIDEELKKIPLPTNMRSLNSALKPVIRGQRVPIGNQDAKVIRAYVHWFDERGNQDIDLTATFLGMGKVKHVGWNGDHNTAIGCYSGDVRHRQGPCAEYIDIIVDEALKAGFKFVVMDARNYNGGSFESVKDCVFGYMERERPKHNEIFVPATLANAVRLQSESSNTLVALIDLETREYIFLDIDMAGIPVASANFEAIMKAVKPYTVLPSLSVYHLMEMHAKSRGELVSEKKADTKFTTEDFGTYVEILKWMGV